MRDTTSFFPSLPLNLPGQARSRISQSSNHRFLFPQLCTKTPFSATKTPHHQHYHQQQENQTRPTQGPGWIRRTSLIRGRSISAETVEWSVPTMDEKPLNRLEGIVWEACRIVDDARVRMPFLTLMSRVEKRDKEEGNNFRARGEEILKKIRNYDPSQELYEHKKGPMILLRLANSWFKGMDEREIVLQGLQDDCESTKFLGVCIPPMINDKKKGDRFKLLVQEEENHEFMRYVRFAAPDVRIISTEIIAMPYQISRARLNGADGVILMSAVFPKKDLEYVVRMTRKLGMLPIVECHSLEEVYAALEIGQVEAVLLVKRDLESLRGGLDGFKELYIGCREILRKKNVVVFAEGEAMGSMERLEGMADGLMVVPPKREDDATKGKEDIANEHQHNRRR